MLAFPKDDPLPQFPTAVPQFPQVSCPQACASTVQPGTVNCYSGRGWPNCRHARRLMTWSSHAVAASLNALIDALVGEVALSTGHATRARWL